jgi:ABC-type oligopeptide transport system substrate-binding subunit
MDRKQRLRTLVIVFAKRKPFDDLRVRQALVGYGLNRAEISKAVFLDHGSPLVSMVPTGALGTSRLPRALSLQPGESQSLAQGSRL